MFKLNMGLGDDGSGIEFAWRDVLLNAFLAIVILLMLVLFLVNPPKKDDTSEIESPGNVIVEASWDHTRDVDVDLWVQAPGDTPVGYSSKAGKIFNLLRDDLGKHGDATDVNLENAYSRGIAAGEYTVNVHLYRNDSQEPIEVRVVVRLKPRPGAPAQEVLSTTVLLRANGHEATAFRFKLTEDGRLVEGSVHHIFKPLRNARSS